MTDVAHNLTTEDLAFVARTLASNDFKVSPLAGDASSRRYYRVITGESSMVLMAWEPFDKIDEYPFLNVQRHFIKSSVQVPRVVATAPKLGLVLLEDLGDLTLERKFWENQNQTLALPYYEKAIDELIKIHFQCSKGTPADSVAFKVAFDTEKLLWEMRYGLEHLVEKLCKITLPARLKDEVQKEFIDICTRLANEPKYICHRDYHSRNIMIKLDSARIIDFQDARLGPIQYDLVSLVLDSYVDMNESLRSQVLSDYKNKAQAYLKGSHLLTPSHFDSVFKLQALQRCFKACGSFASFYNMREDRRYLKYLTPTLVRILSTLKEHSQYKHFLQLFNDFGLCEKDYLNPTEL